ncbi:hypothetical protein DPMN_044664 [Dreissena polymorpha]|uniref:Uncharacterized protein n=1 Tax=Dreissena polymorpha TaxID=45954 RepID=A0A9D4D4K4_DREPO|nr:hypothetical protein DPMN_044664 [Dreissena polymorpha]
MGKPLTTSVSGESLKVKLLTSEDRPFDGLSDFFLPIGGAVHDCQRQKQTKNVNLMNGK